MTHGGSVHPDLAALLEVQADDRSIRHLESRLEELEPRLRQLQDDIDAAQGALDEARRAVGAEERRQREVGGQVAQHRQLEERNQAQLNTISSPREATAAMAQLEQAKRMIGQDERELEAIAARLGELRHTVLEREAAVEELREAQAQATATLSADAAALESELSSLRKSRETRARKVPRSLLQRYDRIHSRHGSDAVYPLRGGSCANCNTTIPLQRRSAMAGSGRAEICEGCGVLLYWSD